MDTLENLHRKVEGAEELKSIVRTMKVMAASNIGQYEMVVNSLEDYYHTIGLGIHAYFKQENINPIKEKEELKRNREQVTCAIVFGSDQGLVGQFNDSLADFVLRSLSTFPGKKEIWAVGERIQLFLSDASFATTKLFLVPNSVNAITPLVGQILIKSGEEQEKGNIKEFYIFHNQPKSRTVYEPIIQRLLPMDEKWRQQFSELKWLSKKIPQVAGGLKPTLQALMREYLFVSLYKACAESLASENSSRLNAMQRADKNIEELLDDLNREFNGLRQSSINEELFDIVSGFEALK